MAGYTRNDTGNNIANGNVIDADDLDGEFNAIETAFGVVTGHTHGGTSGDGAPITRVGPAQDVVVSTTQVLPKTNNALDLGSPTFKFKDAYVDGIAYVDAITLNGTAITSTAAELNALDGITATVTELNYTDGVTSPIQTQLNAKQNLDAELTAIAGLTSAADQLPYFTGSGTAALTTLSSFGRNLIDDADAAAARTTLALGTMATQAAGSVTITGGSITGITDLAVADGGTGVSTITGIIRGNGTSPFTAAVAGTDFLAPAAIGTTVQAFDADLSAVAGLASNGLIARTGAGTAAARTLTAGSGISVTNGDGVSGNPTIAASGLLVSNFDSAAIVTAADTVASNDNDTTVPTTAAIIDYVTSNSNAWEYGWHPYDKVTLGDSNVGEIWSLATNGAQSTITSPDFEDGYEYRFVINLVAVAASVEFRVNLYRETDAAYAGVIAVYSAGAGGNTYSFYADLRDPRQVRNYHLLDVIGGAASAINLANSGQVTNPSIRVSHATAQKLLRAQFTTSSGTFSGTGARILMYRRRVTY